MKLSVSYDNYSSSRVDVDVTDICPNCGRAIEAVLKNSSFYKDGNQHIVYLTLFCNACKTCWVDSYDYSSDYHELWEKDINFYKEIPSDLPKEIVELSPQGARTYIQSLKAEIDGYDTLVGIGLRKAFEFIIKDFLIFLHPDRKDHIKSNHKLGSLISEYIQDPTLVALARSCSWIGNDETHYMRIHQDKDVQDLKKTLKATIRFIEYQIVVQESHDFVNSDRS